jgi:hypothetical protein
MLGLMEKHLAEDNLISAFADWLEIQRIEYGLMMKGLREKLEVSRNFLKSAQSPVHVPVGLPKNLKL